NTRRYARHVLPLVLLLGFGVAFAAATLGAAMLGFDDHPGQLYRLWHVLTYGPAPWAWDRGWWAGYPELQFYPPGFAYLGALLALLARWLDEPRPLSSAMAPLLAAITLLHPAQLPAAVALLALAVALGVPWQARAREALRALALAAALTAFWTLPLLARLAET